ncbi:YozE family protein [Oleidesulfovibrio sp.]|uniref:YozE family protein n=1 Tax=Oleidesulfovibrio sp. TaxID=2909707 RepID=UPI003A8C1524
MYRCSLSDVIKAVPSVQTVSLPEGWFEQLDNKISVFESLYNWMVDDGRVPDVETNTLHSRTYVAEQTMKKLLAAEKKRLRQVKKLKGEALEQALSWTNLGSGPMETIGLDVTIRGEGILVVPEGDRSDFGERVAEIYNKLRVAHLKKIKSKASGATFYWWLISQLERPDNIGDLARDTHDDSAFSEGFSFYEDWKQHLARLHASGAAMDTLKEAWLEYCDQYPERIVPYAWCSECQKRIEISDTTISWDLDSGEVYFLDQDCLAMMQSHSDLSTIPLSSLSSSALQRLAASEEIGRFQLEEIKEKLMLWGVTLS